MSETARQARSSRQLWAAPGSYWDRVVALMQVALPMAIGVLAAFLLLAPLYRHGDVSFLLDKDKVAVAKQHLLIQSARYSGLDDKGQAFVLTAGQAVQKSSAQPIVHMRDLSAGLQLPKGEARINAQRGQYDMNDDTVAVNGPITVNAPDGYALRTSDATVDLKAKTVTSGGGGAGP